VSVLLLIRHTCITFVTVGYLLARLTGDPAFLANVSHLILDEVHERDLDHDLLSLVVKLLLLRQPPSLDGPTRAVRPSLCLCMAHTYRHTCTHTHTHMSIHTYIHTLSSRPSDSLYISIGLLCICLTTWGGRLAQTRLILMSATLQVGLFNVYFSPIAGEVLRPGTACAEPRRGKVGF
jgi:hypothetical protein